MTTKLCPCGRPLHYTDPHVEEQVSKFVSELGECIKVTIYTKPDGDPDFAGEFTKRVVAGMLRTFLVPRHYIALHGLKTRELPDLAQRYNWEEVK